jgi:hypothetical protein
VSGINNPSPPVDPDKLAEAIVKGFSHVFNWRSGISAALLASSEYAMLSLIEDAPRAIKFATLVAPLAAFLTIQFETRLRKIHVDLYPTILVLLTAGYFFFGAWVYFAAPYSHVATPDLAAANQKLATAKIPPQDSALSIANIVTPMQKQIDHLGAKLAAAGGAQPQPQPGFRAESGQVGA